VGGQHHAPAALICMSVGIDNRKYGCRLLLKSLFFLNFEPSTLFFSRSGGSCNLRRRYATSGIAGSVPARDMDASLLYM
jgi:hypothetical protein